MSDSGNDQPVGLRIKRFAGILVLVVGSAFATVTFVLVLIAAITQGDVFKKMVENHFAAAFGIVISFVTSLVLVLVLRVEEGPIEVEAFGFKFKGAGGPLILWVVCFLAFVTALRLLWPLGVK
jgi:RsiW-degrading membrane proteinase PrsW (M82 family)